ncbi:MAG TPA: selenium metabolism-associated LysR family transcriptional regulator [Syntrophomonadaceae bacterium]|nr:selenium metabolism-associated LysR family transcriptional regulator [Syntrophomonadaceae bacterium]
MNINLLRIYIRVVETQNLSRTAEEYGISQPAVTKQIQALEEHYGILLLERSGRRLKPTEAGELLYHFAQEIIKVVDKADKAMQEVAASQRGILSFGASTIPGQYILPPLIKDFKERYPHISISMEIADTEKIFTQIAERELDVGIVGGYFNNRKVEGFRWLDDRLLAIVPANHTLAGLPEINLHSLLNERWIFREKGSGTRKAVEELLASQGLRREELNIYMEAGSTEAVLASVRSGMGISIVSHWAVGLKEAQPGIKAIPISESDGQRSFYIIYPRQKSRRKSVDQFIDFLKEAQERSQS